MLIILPTPAFGDISDEAIVRLILLELMTYAAHEAAEQLKWGKDVAIDPHKDPTQDYHRIRSALESLGIGRPVGEV